MSLIDGDDFVSGDIGSYQEMNRLKNHWRDAIAPTNIQPGMIFSDEDDDKLYHAIGVSGIPLEEILQETLSADKTPFFDNLILDIDSSDISDPPTDTELDALFPSAVDGFIGFIKDTTSGGSLWLAVKETSGWWYTELTLAI